jgi:hypothetical protein
MPRTRIGAGARCWSWEGARSAHGAAAGPRRAMSTPRSPTPARLECRRPDGGGTGENDGSRRLQCSYLSLEVLHLALRRGRRTAGRPRRARRHPRRARGAEKANALSKAARILGEAARLACSCSCLLSGVSAIKKSQGAYLYLTLFF